MSEQTLTLSIAARMLDQAIRDKTYQATRLGNVVASYLAWKEMGATARTLEIYEPYLARLSVMFAADDPGPNEITEEMLLRFLASYPSGSRKLVKTALSGFFRWASSPKRGHCSYNPIPELPALKEPPAKVYDIFSQAEQAQLVKATDHMPLPWVQRLRVLCILDLGIRRSEARFLRPLDFDAVNRTIVVTGKGNKERVVQFSDELWRAFIAYSNRPIPNVKMEDERGKYRETRAPLETDYIFFPIGYHRATAIVSWTKPYQPMSDRGMGSWWQQYVVPASGVRYRSMHTARHTVGTDLATGGADSFAIRDWLGHADVSTTQIYVHNNRGRLQQARAKLDEYRKGTA